jgi:hypothetical protein
MSPATLFALRLTLIALVFPVGNLQAQDPDHPYNTKSNANLIEGWLRGGDPRLVAFGANFAAENEDDGLITTLEQLAVNWNPSERDPYPSEDEFLAMSEILHALIVHRVEAPPETIAAIADTFPDQAVILAARLPATDRTPLLQAWYDAGELVDRRRFTREGTNRLVLARVAAMMLSRAPPPGFAAAILADSDEQFVVSVENGGTVPIRCRTGCPAAVVCADEFEVPAKRGWPPLFQYALEENYAGGDYDDVVVEAGGDRITWRRTPANWRLASCYKPAPLSSETRHRLLAQMLHLSQEQMPWMPQKQITLHWENRDKLLLELESQVNFEEGKMHATIQALSARGLLTPGEAARVRPRLMILVFDDRLPAQPANPALPQPEVRDARTTWRILPGR